MGCDVTDDVIVYVERGSACNQQRPLQTNNRTEHHAGIDVVLQPSTWYCIKLTPVTSGR